MDRSCQSLINPIKELQQARSNVLLTRVPHAKTHGPMAIIKKLLEATTNVIKSRALKNIVPLITHMHARAERADAGNPRHAQPPAHLNGQRIRTKPETKQAAHAPVTHGQLKVWLRHRTNVCRPAMICAQLGPFGGRRPRGSMQTLPDLMRFASSMATTAGLFNENCTIMSKRRWQASSPDMLHNLGSPTGRRGLSKGVLHILHIISQNLTMQ